MMQNIMFIRTSTKDQFPEDQIDPIEKRYKLIKGFYHLISEKQSAFKEESESKRVGLIELKKLIKQRKVNNLYIFHINRLFRNYQKQIEFMQLLKYYNVKLFSVCQDYLDDISKMQHPWNDIVYDMMIKIFADIAERESKDKGKAVKKSFTKNSNGKTIAKQSGKLVGRKGYSSQTIQRVLKMKSEGKSLRQICAEVSYYDKNRNLKKISLGGVHKIILENSPK